MDNPITESPKVEDEEEIKRENEPEAEIVASSASPTPIIDYEAKKIARDAKAKRKDEKTVQQVLKSLDNLKTPEEKLSAMCKKYSELLHENRQLQGTVKQSEKNITMIHREKEQFRHERSKAVLAKTRMEQLCRELQKLNKAQQEETALKLRVEEEKRKEICFTFQSAFAEMNTLTNQNNEKSAKMREENLEMREKIKAVRERIELTETQLDKVRQQAKLELELAREKLVRVTLELTSEKEALMEDKSQLLMKLAKYHVRVKEHEGTEQFLRKQIKIYEEKFEEFKRDVKKTTESLKNFRPESREMKKKMLKLEKETALWKQRWEKTNAAVLQMAEIKEKRDAEMVTLNNKLSTLQELCKAFQRERASLIAQLREKNDGVQVDRKPLAEENRKSMKQVENISKDCEKIKDNLSKLEGSLTEAVREARRAKVYEEETPEPQKTAKKSTKKTKNDNRKKSNQKKLDQTATSEEIEVCDAKSNDEEKKEYMKDEEKMDLTEENKIETTAAEIAILERHETVLKDIEKVLAEQAVLEAKIACVKEMGKSITETSDLKSASPIDDKDNKELPDTSPRNSPESEIVIINDKDELNSDTPLQPASPVVGDETIKDSEITEKIQESDISLSITEFEIVHHGTEPDTATCENESLVVENGSLKSEAEKNEYCQTRKDESAVVCVELENNEVKSENVDKKCTEQSKLLPNESIPEVSNIVDSPMPKDNSKSDSQSVETDESKSIDSETKGKVIEA